MQVHVTGKQIDVAPSVRQHAERRLTDGVAKYFANAIEANVAFSQEAKLVRTDIAVHVGHDIDVHGHALADEPATSLDIACDRIEKQLRRYKRRLRDHHAREREREKDRVEEVLMAQSYVLAPEPEHDSEPAEFHPVIVAENATTVRLLSIGEAVMRLDLGDSPVLLFRNSGSGRLNVVYRRQDGHVGWIDPAVSEERS